MIGAIGSIDDILNCLTFMPSVTEIILCTTFLISYGPSQRLGFSWLTHTLFTGFIR